MDAMQNHSIDQAVRKNCKILNSLSHTKCPHNPMHLGGRGGSGPNFPGTCRHIRWPSKVPAAALLFPSRGATQVTGTQSQGAREGTTPSPSPHSLDEDAEILEREGPGQGQRVSDVPAHTNAKVSQLSSHSRSVPLGPSNTE